MRCAACGGTLSRTEAPIEESFRGETIWVYDVDHYECDSCGEIELDADALDSWSQKIDEAYRAKNGLLSPEEIKSIRTSLGLSQMEFEAVLGVGKISVSRWENGKVIQNKTVDKLMRTMRDHPCAADDLINRAEVQPRYRKANTICKTWKASVVKPTEAEYVSK